MNSSQKLKTDVIDVISFARFYGNILTPADCIMLHQWAQRGNEPTEDVKNKFTAIKKRIKAENWGRPEYQYNSQLRLMYRTNASCNFKEMPNE